jgi:mono/diheme cytochrome c family protein
MKNLKHGCCSRMFSRNTITSFIVAVALPAVVGCASALYQPLPEHATPNATLTQLTEGRRLYVASCGGCHTLYAPGKFTQQTWMHNLDEMQERSKIDDAQKNLIFQYLVHSPAK